MEKYEFALFAGTSMAVLDALAHLTNLVGLGIWIAITPFAYGTPLYEASGFAYWAVASCLFLYGTTKVAAG